MNRNEPYTHCYTSAPSESRFGHGQFRTPAPALDPEYRFGAGRTDLENHPLARTRRTHTPRKGGG